ncbi:kelch repeat and BTB domain-containing protein 8-like [Culex pipiens pallens]|uniref:kelch repeat and BTB domain-containing protein 8-like n=1 Tax=Culex pipiens pallens TaxID=42434 RepID=UPI0019537A00|nr:kelch repeat and BTB domain-containing protein 8-like [Culex pipiens pallens]
MALVGKGFSKYLNTLFNDPELSDVAIVLDNDEGDGTSAETKTFHGHRVILATVSDYFRSMLYGSFVEATKKEIRLPGVPYSIFLKIMEVVYLGKTVPCANGTLEEAEEFYSLAQMLLMNSEMKFHFGEWMIERLEWISSWKRDLLKIFALAFEWDLPSLKDECGSKFNETANEHLENSTFVDLPLRAVQMILDTSNICCTRAELKRAIQAWIEHHKGEISADVAAELNRKVYRFGRLCYDFKILSISRTKAMQKPEDVQPLGGCAESMEALLAEPHEYSYISQTKVLKCICLRGAKICLRANQKFGPEHGRIKSEFELQFIVEGYGRLHRRNLTVRYDLTQHEQQSVTIFFPKMACCKDTNVGFWLRWKGTGVQPVLQNYVAAKNNKTIEADSTYVTHIIYEDQVYDCNNRCPECPVPYVYDWYSSSS